MKMQSSCSARLDVSGLCLIAALAAACSFDTSQLRALADGAVEHPAVSDAGASGGGGDSTSPPDVPSAAGGSGGTAAKPPVAPIATGGSGGSSVTPSGGTTRTGGTTYTPTGGTVTLTGGTIYNPTGGTIRTGGTVTLTGGTIYNPTGGTVTLTGGTIYNPTGGAVTPTGGTVSATPTGTTVTFVNGKAQGAMVGYGWVALGSLDTITDPTCGPGKTPITNATPCMTSTNWSSPTALCITGLVPALGTPPDYTANWGVSVGVNADTIIGGGLGQSFTSITIEVTGSPSSGLRAVVHKKGDPDATTYCATLTAGAIPLTSFSTSCYTPASPGVAITAADVPNIDKISVQVSSGSAAITVSNLCITGITFAK